MQNINLEHNTAFKAVYHLKIHFYELWKMQRIGKENSGSPESNKSTKEHTRE